MLRITIQESLQASTFKLEGKLTGPWVRELEQTWTASPSAAPGHDLTIDLADVTFIDCAGKDLLARMHESGATLVARSPMNRCIVDEIARAGKHILIALAVALSADFDASLAGGVAAWDTEAPDVSSPTTATPATRSPGNRYRVRSFARMSSPSLGLNRSSAGTSS